MAKTIHIALSMIKIGGKTQQRDICIETQQAYAELMRDGVKFPAAEVVYDGKNYWLWDGFHRFFAAKDADQKTLLCNITPGTQRDAVRMSLKANDTHGLPRDKVAKLNSVEVIENDPEWKSLADVQKAEMVGISVQHYRRLRGELKDMESPESAHCAQSGQSKSTNDAPMSAPSTQADDESENPENGDTKPAKKDSGAIVMDSEGHNVPKHLEQIFLDRHVIQGYINELNEMARKVKEQVEANKIQWFYFRLNPFETELANVKRQFTFALPHSVCVYCGGVDSRQCRACKGAGFMNKDGYVAAPKELKQ